MESDAVDLLRYPIGKFIVPKEINEADLQKFILEIEQLPSLIRAETALLPAIELNATYRPQGWNINQLVNHLVDSHMNSIIRFKLALTENVPTIKPYEEDLWVQLADTVSCPLPLTLELLDMLHQRWVILLTAFSKHDWERKIFHPVSKREWRLDELLAMYTWHGKHHLQHIRIAKGIK